MTGIQQKITRQAKKQKTLHEKKTQVEKWDLFTKVQIIHWNEKYTAQN